MASLAPIAHYDASTLGLSNGASVTSWPDSAGIQGSFAGAGGTPTYVTGAQNGLSVVEFSTNPTKMNATWAVVPTRPFTLILAGKALSAVASQGVWFHQTFGTTFFMNGAVWDIAAGTDLIGGTQDTAFHVWTFLVNGVSSILRIDGVQLAAGTSGASASAGSICQISGAFRHGEFYAYNGNALALSTESDLRTKWGTA